SNGDDLLNKLPTFSPDFIVLDLDMPVESGLKLIPKIKKIKPATKIIIFTMHEGEGYYREAKKEGANAYILKSDDLNSLPGLLSRIKNGEFVYSEFFKKDTKTKNSKKFQFSQKEHEVLTMIVNGFTAKEIGERMGISKRTVEYYSKRLKDKFDAENIVELVNRAREEYFT
ncbi:MAG: response regulator transcription factor, partial [Leptospiraceae bacterium]|nr:response regulator transcription factor [Leptospiraceae bacterium]